MRGSLVLSLMIAALGCLGCRQESAVRAADRAEVFAPERLREDLAFLREAVVRRHPRFHDQQPDAAFEQAFTEVGQALGAPMTRAEAFRELARLNPTFRDAHTLLMPTFATGAGAAGAAPFPIAVRLDGSGALLVDGDWVESGSGQRLASGTPIRAINGEDSDRLLADLSRYGHGETAALRRHMLTVMFPDWLAAVRGWTGAFRMTLAEPDGRLRSLAITPSDRWAPAQARHDPDLPSLRELGDGIALLRLPTFDVDDDPRRYRAAVAAAFAALRQRGTKALILDVRGNTGGQSEAGAEVVRYLTDRPINQVSRARERLNDDNRGLFGYKGRAGAMREMDLSRDGLIEPAPAAQRFRGKVVLLIDAMTYSAAILFATTLQDHGLAVVVGQATGGYANQTGNMEPVRLPNTGLTAYIPSRVFVRPSGDLRAVPVVPDVTTEPAGRDADHALAAALALLHASR